MVVLKRSLSVLCATALALTIASATSAGGDRKHVDVSLELVGQTGGSAVGRAIQFGYVAHLHGLSIFNAGGPEDEKTARLSFFADTNTLRVTNNGPLRILSRDGTFTLYRDPTANGDFARPESFSDGTAVLAARLRQQVIINMLTGAFTALNVNRITSTTPFEVGGKQVRLGKVGQTFRTLLAGQSNASPPPGAHIAGYTIPGDDPPKANPPKRKHRR
jgi:hypothetical protein